MRPRLASHGGSGIRDRLAPARADAAGRCRRLIVAVLGLALWGGAGAGCAGDQPVSTPPITPGTSGAPREVNLILKDYLFIPKTLDLVPGETVLLHVVNGGLITHEVVFGGPDVQKAWHDAEAAVANPPPGPTPVVSVPAELAGLRVVVGSGVRQDVVWTVPTQGLLLMGCHIPGHFEKGMAGIVRYVGPGGVPIESALPAGSPSPAP